MNVVDFIKGYLYQFSEHDMREWLDSQQAHTPGKSSSPNQSKIPLKIANVSRPLAADLAGALVLCGLENGAAVYLNHHYYQLVTSVNENSPAEVRAQNADIMCAGYMLATENETPGPQPEQFLNDYPALLQAYAVQAGHKIVADRYPSSLYLNFLGTIIRASDTEITTVVTRVAIPVAVVVAAKVLIGITLATTPLGWGITGVLALAGAVGMYASIHNGLNVIRRARNASAQMDLSLGPDRADTIAWLFDEADRVKADHNCAASEKRMSAFVTQAEKNLAEVHGEKFPVPAQHEEHAAQQEQAVA